MKKIERAPYISAHRKYVDYRIARLSSYVTLTGSTGIPPLLDSLMHPGAPIPSSFEDPGLADAREAFLELRELIRGWDILEQGDIIGYLYQQFESTADKKRKGQYFTPGEIVGYLVDTALGEEVRPTIPAILDPACGSGQFLIAAYRALIRRYPVTPKEIMARLHGFENDPIAASIARFNLSRIANLPEAEIRVFRRNYLFRDDLGFAGETTAVDTNKFDLIIGNPPWCSKFTLEEKQYYRRAYRSASSGINTFTLFIERSFDLLGERGRLAFLLPEAYLNIKAHRGSRAIVLESAVIDDISLWGEQFKGVFAPAVSVIMTHEQDREVRTRHIVNIRTAIDRAGGTALLVPQASYGRANDQIFNINYSRRAVSILSCIEQQETFTLRDNAKFFLGIVTGNNGRHISATPDPVHPDPIIVGKDVSQYRIDFSDHYFRYDPSDLQQVAPQHLYLHPAKVLYKFIGKRLTFAIDRDGHYSLNNVNGFIPSFDFCNLESIVAMLNSSVIQYYYEKNFFTVKVLRGNLELLPLKTIGKGTQKKLAQLTNEVMGSGNPGECMARQTIEDIIFHEYGIKDRDASHLVDRLILPSTLDTPACLTN